MHKPRIFELENRWYSQFVGEENFYDNYSYFGDKTYFINPQINNFINFFAEPTIFENPPKSKY
jgi:hypothetical protein